MPTYDYVCDANDRIIEVMHPMNAVVDTWGKLCELARIDPGATATDAPVRRKIGAASVHTPRVGEWKKTGKKPIAARGHTHGTRCGCGH